jgi:dTMP kinase
MKLFLKTRGLFLKKGIFIVIDGNDGSGKTTQIKLLKERLEQENRKVVCVDFPNYKNNFFGKVLDKYLHGKNSGWEKYNSDIASIVYSADRWESKDFIKTSLDKGKIVIADRYVSANQIHQGGKIKDIEVRKAFINWLDKLEYEVFKIPMPNLVVYLSVPVSVSEELLRKRYEDNGGQKDVHEDDPDFLRNSKECADWLAETQPNWIKIDCAENGKMRPPEDIHSEIYEKIKSFI